MTDPRPWPRVKWTRAGQVAPLLDGAADIAPVVDFAPPVAFALLRKTERPAAVHFVAQCLPRIAALQWMEACLQRSAAPTTPAHAVAREAIGRWLADPSDSLRRAAFVAGDLVGWDNADGIGCLAVFLSGGSLAPAEQAQPVNPAPGVFGRTVAGAVMMAALSDGALLFAGRLDEALDLVEQLAAGDPLPKASARPAPAPAPAARPKAETVPAGSREQPRPSAPPPAPNGKIPLSGPF